MAAKRRKKREKGDGAGRSERSKEPVMSVGLYVMTVRLLVRCLPALKLLGALDGGFDRGFGDGAEGLGGVVLVAFQLKVAEAVGG